MPLKKITYPRASWLKAFTKPEHRLELVVLLCMAFFGLLFVFIVPPMQGPDEPHHLYRAYQLSEGSVLPQYIHKSTGGYLPIGLVRLGVQALRVVQPGQNAAKFSRRSFNQLHGIQLGTNKVPVTFSNTAVYSPVAYVPSVIAIWIGRLYGASPLAMMYLARLADLIVGIVVVVLALRLTPIFRLPMAMLALLPMTLSEFSLVTADTVTMALSFLLIALCIRFAVQKTSVTNWQAIALIIFSILLALTKPALFPLAVAAFCILLNKTTSRRRALTIAAVVCIAAFVTTIVWNDIIIRNFALTGYQNDFIGTNYDQQLLFVVSHPVLYIRVLYETFLTLRFDYVPATFVGRFGWLDTPMPLLAVIASICILVLATFISNQSERIQLPKWLRALLLIGGLATVVITATSEYLLSNAVKLPYVNGFQGRYLIPGALVTMLALGLGNGQVLFSARHARRFSRYLTVASILLLMVAMVVIGNRFYRLPVLIPSVAPVPPASPI